MSRTVVLKEDPSSDTQQLWQEFADRLRVFITRRVGSQADAEDILQDVFLRFHQHAGGIQHADRLTAWLFQVTRNAITDYYRAPVRREQAESVAGGVLLTWAETATETEETEGEAAQTREELASCLRPMIERLPPLYREAVVLVDLSGLTQSEAATRLGLSVSGMKSRVQRGRRALKNQLVECCPVRLDSGGRIADYAKPARVCTSCAGVGKDGPAVGEPANQAGQCCGPATVAPGETRSLGFRA